MHTCNIGYRSNIGDDSQTMVHFLVSKYTHGWFSMLLRRVIATTAASNKQAPPTTTVWTIRHSDIHYCLGISPIVCMGTGDQVLVNKINTSSSSSLYTKKYQQQQQRKGAQRQMMYCDTQLTHKQYKAHTNKDMRKIRCEWMADGKSFEIPCIP